MVIAFFPSTPREKVYQFFRSSFEVSADIAEFLANITTVNLDLSATKNINEIDAFLFEKNISTRNHLISGAPTSQILSYYANQNMFNKLDMFATKCEKTMSVYVDDITFSSDNRISHRFIESIHRIIGSYGFRISAKKSRYYTKHYPKEITGVIINRAGEPELTNSLQRKIITELQIIKNDPSDNRSKEKLRGLIAAARQVVPGSFPSIQLLAKDK